MPQLEIKNLSALQDVLIEAIYKVLMDIPDTAEGRKWGIGRIYINFLAEARDPAPDADVLVNIYGLCRDDKMTPVSRLELKDHIGNLVGELLPADRKVVVCAAEFVDRRNYIEVQGNQSTGDVAITRAPNKV